jgi:putative transposase
MVAIEDLQIRNMSRNGGVAKKNLNKSILDQGWGEFRRQLEYKMDWAGGTLIAVPAQYTSQTCPCCGHIAKANRLTQAKFACVECGYENNADVVGALNILARGHRVFACGEDVRHELALLPRSAALMKQEPTEVTMQTRATDHA